MSIYAQAMSDPENYWPPREVSAILDATRKLKDKKGGADELHALLFQTLWLTGRRIGEVIGTRPTLARKNVLEKHPEYTISGLCPKHVDFEKGSVTWYLEKKHRVKWVRMQEHPALILKLKDFIIRNGIRADSRVFNTYEKKAERVLKSVLDGLTYELNGERLPVRAGSLHTFRHSHADFVNKVCGMSVAKYRTQHANIATLDCYLHPDELYAEKLFSVLDG